jgi:hypothetical protein
MSWPRPYLETYALLGFAYSPAVGLAILPATELPWPVFHALLAAASLGALYYLVGRWAIVGILLPPVAIEIWAANINLLIAAAIVAGFRYPAFWAFPILTKVASGVGVLWFALRGEWRPFAIALGTTAAIALVSFLLHAPTWADWFVYLRTSAEAEQLPHSIAIPLLLRVPFAVVALVIGVRTDRRWLVPIATVLATPVIWPATLSILLACWPLRSLRPVIGGPTPDQSPD